MAKSLIRKRLPSAAVRRGTSAHESIRGAKHCAGVKHYPISRVVAAPEIFPAQRARLLFYENPIVENPMRSRCIARGARRAGAAVPIAAAALLAADARLGHWPQWRGPAKDGMALTGAPSHWSETQKIRWKTDIPGRGFSSPVVWGDRIVVTSAVPTGAAPPQQEHRFEVFCLDRRTGKVLWQRTA